MLRSIEVEIAPTKSNLINYVWKIVISNLIGK